MNIKDAPQICQTSTGAFEQIRVNILDAARHTAAAKHLSIGRRTRPGRREATVGERQVAQSSQYTDRISALKERGKEWKRADARRGVIRIDKLTYKR